MAEEKGTTFNDSVHGSITLPPLCIKIIDTLEFQRMRNLKQLGLAYFVYPGASHNRFEHGLGVCHLAGRMVDQLNNNSNSVGKPDHEMLVSRKEKLCVQIAGLCHDMGHGPFSHAWEGFLDEVRELREKTGNNLEEKLPVWRHEKSSVEMFQHMIVSNQLHDEFVKYGLLESDIKFIEMLIEGSPGGEKVFLCEIVSNALNGIDVDKWDYFLRDSKYLNLSQSFDHNRLLNTCRVMEIAGEHPETGNKHIAYRDKDVSNVWDMFQVRAQLHQKAYQHPVVKVLELMWTDALLAADAEGYTITTSENAKTRLSQAQTNPRVWKYVTDHIFYEILNNGETLASEKGLDGEPILRFSKAQNILRRILNRDMYHQIARINVDDPSKENVDDKIKEIEKILQANSLSKEEYDLVLLNIDMGKMKKGASTPFDNYFFYTKDGEKAISKDISRYTIFPLDPSRLKRVEILVLGKRLRNDTREINGAKKSFKTVYENCTDTIRNVYKCI